jgi:hypothetical protein
MAVAGLNRALQENQLLGKAASALGRPCIFLSHISVDKPAVEHIADYITEYGNIDIYIDTSDDDLQRAANRGDAVAITAFVERGVANCTHMLCLVSANTVRSWWVPYELGFGKKSGKPLATLKLKDVDDLPSYLEISDIIRGTRGLNVYLSRVKQGLSKSAATSSLTETLIRHTDAHPLDPYLDWQG